MQENRAMTYLLLILSFVFSFVIGFLFVALCITERDNAFYGLISSSTIPIGLGLSSLTTFIPLAIIGQIQIFMVILCEICIMFILIYIRNMRLARPVSTKPISQYFEKSASYIVMFFLCSTILAVIHFALRAVENPHGEPDAFYLWNTCARFIFRDSLNWKIGFLQGGWSHPDYPLLLPLNIVRIWSVIGKETLIVPVCIAFFFTFGTIGICVSGLTILRGQMQGFIVGIILLGTPYFIKHGASQYADIPLSCYILLTIVLLNLQDSYHSERQTLFLLMGVSVGFAAWTKNEGLLFFISFIIARILTMFIAKLPKSQVTKELRLFLIGILPLLCIIGFFKLFIAPQNDLISSENVPHLISQLTDSTRYIQIGKAFLRQFIEPYSTLYSTPIIIALLYAMFLGVNCKFCQKAGVITSGIILLLLYIGYFFIYILTPHDLVWHLNTSLSRLWLQLYPSTIFVLFMIIATPYERKSRES